MYDIGFSLDSTTQLIYQEYSGHYKIGKLVSMLIHKLLQFTETCALMGLTKLWAHADMGTRALCQPPALENAKMSI